MEKEIIKFREILLDNMYQGLKQRFDDGDFDQGIEFFLDGNSVAINYERVFNGKALSSLTKNIIAGLPIKDAIRRFNEAAVELEKGPIEVTRKKSKE